jgi:Nucleotidyltransferase
MVKPISASGYDEQVTGSCERVLVTLLRGLGPWKNSVCLVGGLAPRYLAPKLTTGKVPHAGTGDVDIVVQLEMLAETDAYHSLEENLKKMGFERAENEKGEKQSWRWKTKTERGMTVILELLADNPEVSGGKVKPLPTEGNISALNIPHSSMVFDHYEVKEIAPSCSGRRALRSRRFATPTSSALHASRPLPSISGMSRKMPTILPIALRTQTEG